jgi:hypothetical protein
LRRFVKEILKKFKENPEMISMITRSIPEEAVVDSLEHSTQAIADRAQLVLKSGTRRNQARVVSTVPATVTTRTPSTLSQVTASASASFAGDPMFGFLDQISNNLLRAFGDGADKRKISDDPSVASESAILRLSTLREERRKCWLQIEKFELQLESDTTPVERKSGIERRLKAENESLDVTEQIICELEESCKQNRSKKSKPSIAAENDDPCIAVDNNDPGESKDDDTSCKHDPGQQRRTMVFRCAPTLGLIYNWIGNNDFVYCLMPVPSR